MIPKCTNCRYYRIESDQPDGVMEDESCTHPAYSQPYISRHPEDSLHFPFVPAPNCFIPDHWLLADIIFSDKPPRSEDQLCKQIEQSFFKAMRWSGDLIELYE